MLPRPIYKICKHNEVITIEALNEEIYEKCYFDKYEYDTPLESPRRVKRIRLKSASKCNTMRDYFNQLVRSDGYSYINT